MIIAGTGHRPNKLGGYGNYSWIKLVNVAIETLPDNTTKIISGMALGWDQAIVQAAILKGIPFTAAIPFLGQESRWPLNSQVIFNEFLEKASEIIYICDPGYANWKMQVRNKWMVDNCDAVWALYNGDKSGGTFNCIQYAKSKNKPIINAWEKFSE